MGIAKVWFLLLGSLLLSILSVQVGFASEREEIIIVDDAFVSNFNGQHGEVMKERNREKLIVGKLREAYMKLAISDLTDIETIKQIQLEMVTTHGGNQLFFQEASNELTSGGQAGSQWDSDTITYDNKPSVLKDTKTYEVTLPNGEAVVTLDITDLIKEAKAANRQEVTIHFYTEKSLDESIAASELFSIRSTRAPYVKIIRTTDEVPQTIEGHKIGNYFTNASLPVKYMKIKTDSGSYFTVRENGAIYTVENEQEAETFALYVAEPIHKITGSLKPTAQIQSTTTGKFLTFQNYFSESDEQKNYYQKKDERFLFNFTAASVNDNERLSIHYYPESNRYTIASDLDTLRDEPSVTHWFLHWQEGSLTASRQQNRPAYFVFEETEFSGALIVDHEIRANQVFVRWLPITSDDLPDDYQLNVSAKVQKTSDYFQAVFPVADLPESIEVTYQQATYTVKGVSEARSFTHPGIQLTTEHLDQMKQRVAEKKEPWYSDYLKLKQGVSNDQSALTFIDTPLEGVGRGAPEGHGNIGKFESASNAAYFLALQWVITEEDDYAQKATEIINGWSQTLKVIDGRDRILGAAISSSKLIEAAEILAHYQGGYSGYTAEDISQTQEMLINTVYPVIEDLGVPMLANGNWDTAAMNAMMAIGLFTDRQPIVERAINLYQSIHINGSIAVYVSDTGQSVESGRDQAHAQLGISYLASVAEAAANQGIDLYSLHDYRLVKAFEWAAKYNLFEEVPFTPLMNVFQNPNRGYWTRLDSERINRGELRPIYEQVAARFHDSPVDTTWTSKAAAAMRAQGYIHNDHLNFSTLTFYNGPIYETAPSLILRIRTRLEPWYERTLTKVGDEYVYETRNSYLSANDASLLQISKKYVEADLFQLIPLDGGMVALWNQSANCYLSITDEKNAAGDQLIKANQTEITESETFSVMGTGRGFVFLTAPFYEDRIIKIDLSAVAKEQDPELTLVLGQKQTTDANALAEEEKLLFYYDF